MQKYNYEEAERLVIALGQVVCSSKHIEISKKGKVDFVTNVDIEVSETLKRELAKTYPSVGFFSEEEAGGLSDNCWILDPIDGTTNYIFGQQASSISLAHFAEGAVQYGIVLNPFNKEVFTAERGGGAWLNKTTRLRVSNHVLGESLLEFGAGSSHKDSAQQTFALGCTMFQHGLDIRRMCSSALALCHIAMGRLDGYFEQWIKPWDIAAGSLILEEAGGRISCFDSKPFSFDQENSIIASNGCNHDEMLEVVSVWLEEGKR